ncbi:hypothetical protein QFC19_007449 [Naganishia cerealis]|uniref:Uncharacterized protein n=1 Tax=Naganishia cerealis TaxID=610337 RepID=A0ACC2V8X2_9TREE|nr:hypothetical protein QFC19_007449 [Naganishia cerealis]
MSDEDTLIDFSEAGTVSRAPTHEDRSVRKNSKGQSKDETRTGGSSGGKQQASTKAKQSKETQVKTDGKRKRDGGSANDTTGAPGASTKETDGVYHASDQEESPEKDDDENSKPKRKKSPVTEKRAKAPNIDRNLMSLNEARLAAVQTAHFKNRDNLEFQRALVQLVGDIHRTLLGASSKEYRESGCLKDLNSALSIIARFGTNKDIGQELELALEMAAGPDMLNRHNSHRSRRPNAN